MKLQTLLLSTLLVGLLSSCGSDSKANKAAESPAPVSSSTSSPSSRSSSASSVSSIKSEPASSSSSSAAASACASQTCETLNKEAVQKIYAEVINNNHIDLVETLFDLNVKIHITSASSGSTGETAYLQSLKNANPGYKATIKHIAADGDYVAVHWHLSAKPADEFTGKAVVDLYKLSNRKITEHWSLAEDLSPSTASGNSLFSDVYQYASAKPQATQESEAANKTLVTMVYLGMFNDKNLALIDQYIDPNYIQHNPYVPTGREPLRNFVSTRTPGGLSFFATLADDDLVWTFSGEGNLSLMDIFRVDNKKIVEHYDVF